eukprot:GFKZ01003793.1.p1 GENE.GFKZ01003793.1~~GFKZ01003793.1.p1  ORF type:complete len:274 (+),score=21.44 GFKZ01003793.1:71-892(+)
MSSENVIGTPVELNVYDLLHRDNPDVVPNINWYLYSVGMGLYHSGVSVFGTEYCYGGHPESNTGVFEVPPRKAPDAKFRQTILIGRTQLSPAEVQEVVAAMSTVWLGNTYNLLTRYVFLAFGWGPKCEELCPSASLPLHRLTRSFRCCAFLSLVRFRSKRPNHRNCNHFASDLCERLTGNAAPEWVNRLAWVGEKAKFLLPKGFDTPMAAPVTAERARMEREAEELLNSPNPTELDENFLGDDEDPDHIDEDDARYIINEGNGKGVGTGGWTG